MGIDVDAVYNDAPPPDDIKAAIALEMEAAAAVSADEEETQTLHKYVRVSLRLDEEERRVKAQADAILKNIEARRRGLDYVYGPMVRGLVERLIKGGKTRSLKTLWGTVGFRKAPAQVFVKDEGALMAYARVEHPDWIRTKHEPIRSAIKDYAKQTGDIPPGCEFVDERDTFYVKGTKLEAGADGDAPQPD